MKGKLFSHPTEDGLCRSEYQQRTVVKFFSCQRLHYAWAVNEWILVLNTDTLPIHRKLNLLQQGEISRIHFLSKII